MNPVHSRIVSALGVVLGLGAIDAAACELRIARADDVRIDGARAYDVFSPSGVADRFRIRIERIDAAPPVPEAVVEPEEAVGADQAGEGGADSASGPVALAEQERAAPCRARVYVEGRSNGTVSRGSERLQFGLTSRRAGQTTLLSSVDYVIEGLEPGDDEELELEFVVPPGQFVAHGTYLGELAVFVAPDDSALASAGRLRGDEPGGDREIVPVVVEVGAAVRVTFAGTEGRSRTVDFGELKRGARPALPVELLVQASSDYTLRFRSENGGRLRRLARGAEAFVPYELQAAKQRVGLDGGAVVSVRGVRTERSGQRVPLDFRISDDTVRKPAGRYVDRLTVEITPTRVGG